MSNVQNHAILFNKIAQYFFNSKNSDTDLCKLSI